MNFALYLIGYLLVGVGVVYGVSQIPGLPQWVTIAVALVLAGIGIIASLSRAKGGDVADAQSDRLRQNPPGTRGY